MERIDKIKDLITAMTHLTHKDLQKDTFEFLSEDELKTLLIGVGLFLIATSDKFIIEYRKLASDMLLEEIGVNDEILH